jgi:hypothetical protein
MAVFKQSGEQSNTPWDRIGLRLAAPKGIGREESHETKQAV